jgi:colicin import membrane protein
VKWPVQRGSKGSLALSILLHAALVALIFGVWYWTRTPKPAEPLAIEGRVVMAQPGQPDGAPPPPEPVAEPPPEEAAAEPPPVPEPAADPEAARREEEARVAEERRIADERLAAERKTEEAAAQQRAEQARKEQAERERREKEKADREKADKERAERERLAREKAAKDEADRIRRQREEELGAQLAAEQRAAAVRASGLANQYVAQITARIERAWIRPPSATVGLQCEVRVTQVPGGAVTAVQIGRCNGDESVKQSIEAAVYRASPLPEPPDPALFERNLVINFQPEK